MSPARFTLLISFRLKYASQRWVYDNVVQINEITPTARSINLWNTAGAPETPNGIFLNWNNALEGI